MNIDDLYKIHQKTIDSYLENINKSNYSECLEQIYKYIKSVTPSYFEGDNKHETYKLLRSNIFRAESMFSFSSSFIPTIPFDINDKKDSFIDYLVYETRKMLVEKRHLDLNKINDLSVIDFANDCQTASEYIKRICDKNDVSCCVFPMYPGYDEKAYLFNGTGIHYMCTIKYEGRSYLVDVTYSQFFRTYKNIIDRLGIVEIEPFNIGTFMFKTEYGKNLAIELIKKGYVELTSKNFKTYLDAFTISYRNGLYYEETGDLSYKSQYSIQDYINFFEGKDSQVNHEGTINLGYQKVPLKKSSFKF